MTGGRVMVCGSRALGASARPAVASVVRAALASGSRLVVGCASGADAAALAAALAAGPGAPVSLFAAFGQAGAGAAGRASNVRGVAAAVAGGLPVSWWAGGPASVPLRARLARRSLAAVRFAARGGPGSSLVAFAAALPPRPFSSGPFPSCGSGSWSSVAAAALLGLPVSVVPVGPLASVSPASLPPLPGGGGGGVWVSASRGWRWSPAPGLF